MGSRVPALQQQGAQQSPTSDAPQRTMRPSGQGTWSHLEDRVSQPDDAAQAEAPHAVIQPQHKIRLPADHAATASSQLPGRQAPKKQSSLQRLSSTFSRIPLPLQIRGIRLSLLEAPEM